jgi:CRP/FNR family nitrogen fixation transcriptional regulator
MLAFERPPAGCASGGESMSYERDEEVFAQGQPARSVYRVLSGAVRLCRLLADGRRQIVAFHLADDVFGLDGDLRHTLAAEAITQTSLQITPRSAFLNDRAVGSGSAMGALLSTFHRAQDHMLLLGRNSACERLSAFLLDFHRRTGRTPIDLPMSRQDIADHLGLTIETVSRTITQLQNDGLIALLSSRRIALCDVAALERICL